MEMNGKKLNLDFVDSLFEELNEKVEADNLNSADASCGGGVVNSLGCSMNCQIQLSW